MRTQMDAAVPVFRVEIGAGFLLLCALIIFFSGPGFLPALLSTAFFHELGHLSAMLFFGAFPTRLHLGAAGFQIDYSGGLSPFQEMLTALAGPALGLLFSFFCALLGLFFQGDFFFFCAGLGLLLNLFNLLPILPLDGGRVLDWFLNLCFGRRGSLAALRLSLALSLLLFLSGFVLLLSGFGPALFGAGALLLLFQRRTCQSPR